MPPTVPSSLRSNRHGLEHGPQARSSCARSRPPTVPSPVKSEGQSLGLQISAPAGGVVIQTCVPPLGEVLVHLARPMTTSFQQSPLTSKMAKSNVSVSMLSGMLPGSYVQLKVDPTCCPRQMSPTRPEHPMGGSSRTSTLATKYSLTRSLLRSMP